MKLRIPRGFCTSDPHLRDFFLVEARIALEKPLNRANSDGRLWS